ncbi:MAG: hypothetical protein QXJ06_05055, partial [Candidatus Aenigmatarchaeota archaeon]
RETKDSLRSNFKNLKRENSLKTAVAFLFLNEIFLNIGGVSNPALTNTANSSASSTPTLTNTNNPTTNNTNTANNTNTNTVTVPK